MENQTLFQGKDIKNKIDDFIGNSYDFIFNNKGQFRIVNVITIYIYPIGPDGYAKW